MPLCIFMIIGIGGETWTHTPILPVCPFLLTLMQSACGPQRFSQPGRVCRCQSTGWYGLVLGDQADNHAVVVRTIQELTQ